MNEGTAIAMRMDIRSIVIIISIMVNPAVSRVLVRSIIAISNLLP